MLAIVQTKTAVPIRRISLLLQAKEKYAWRRRMEAWNYDGINSVTDYILLELSHP